MDQDKHGLDVGNVGEDQVHRESKEAGQGRKIRQDGQHAPPATIAFLLVDSLAIAFGAARHNAPDFLRLQDTL
jgi:hypothetical protein